MIAAQRKLFLVLALVLAAPLGVSHALAKPVVDEASARVVSVSTHGASGHQRLVLSQDKDTRTVVAKSATLELTPGQAETISLSAMAGSLSLSLRPLGDQGEVASLEDRYKKMKDNGGPVSVIRYGQAPNAGKLMLQEKPQ